MKSLILIFGLLLATVSHAKLPFTEGSYEGRYHDGPKAFVMLKEMANNQGSFLAILHVPKTYTGIFQAEPSGKPNQYTLTPLTVQPNGSIGMGNVNPSHVLTLYGLKSEGQPQFWITTASSDNKQGPQQKTFIFKGDRSRYHWSLSPISGVYKHHDTGRQAGIVSVPNDQNDFTLTSRVDSMPGSFDGHEKYQGFYTFKQTQFLGTGNKAQEVPSFIGFFVNTSCGSELILAQSGNPAKTETLKLEHGQKSNIELAVNRAKTQQQGDSNTQNNSQNNQAEASIKDYSEGTEVALDTSQAIEIAAWDITARGQIEHLLERIPYLSDVDARYHETKAVLDDLLKKSKTNAPQTLMRYALNRGLLSVLTIEAETDSKSVPGIVDQKFELLRNVIDVALKYSADKYDYIKKLEASKTEGAKTTQIPYAGFGIDFIKSFASVVNNISDSTARYAIYKKALQWYVVDIMKDDHKKSEPVAAKINWLLNLNKETPKTDTEATLKTRELRLIFDQTVGGQYEVPVLIQTPSTNGKFNSPALNVLASGETLVAPYQDRYLSLDFSRDLTQVVMGGKAWGGQKVPVSIVQDNDQYRVQLQCSSKTLVELRFNRNELNSFDYYNDGALFQDIHFRRLPELMTATAAKFLASGVELRAPWDVDYISLKFNADLTSVFMGGFWGGKTEMARLVYRSSNELELSIPNAASTGISIRFSPTERKEFKYYNNGAHQATFKPQNW